MEILGERREYLTIKILHNDMTVRVPTENAALAGLRRVIDEETVKKVLDVQRFSFGIPASPASAEFTQAWTDAVNRVLAGQQTPAQALNQAQKEAVAAIKAATK